ncbi:MAG: DNA-3-methyladenine glycosylase 2 [Betaproteobacteria bacterium]|nr:DNA-3-methyladenine glycosylase 2 [Betaproteobacteria bacterium]MDE2622983.1 DNA-3-methyladenine glycosylase 2 [Betaproteobacteria bacterium]
MPRRASLQSLELPLPRNYRVADTLEFHQRDPERVSERVDGTILQKGLVWRGAPACLTVHFASRRATAELAVDGPGRKDDPARFEQLVRRMLGLTQPIAAFERKYRRHPVLGPLIARHGGLRVPLVATPFEALSWAIISQQISVRAAVATRRKLVRAAGKPHSGGLLCYPDAQGVARLAPADLRAAGFTQGKAEALLALARSACSGEIPLERWSETLPVEEIRTALLSRRGIGPWTVDYALMRGFGWLDGSLHGDLAMRRQLQRVLGLPEPVSAAQAREWLSAFSPWRALVAFHLWAA